MITILPLIIFWLVIDIPYLLYRILLLFHYSKRIENSGRTLISVIIPAYNEEVCIEKTLLSCLHQSYRPLEVVVVDDGSTDNTKEVVEKFKKRYEHDFYQKGLKFKVIHQKNQGKAKALNTGRIYAHGEYLVTIDADSYLHHLAIERILHYFSSPKVGAVAGNIAAISHGEFLGWMQKVEYELGIYFLRESQAALGDVLVTPGAFSAYRKKAVKKFEEGTLTEDFDSSVRMLERGYKIVMAPDALCYTQVPLSVSDLIKQRVRWQQGGLEVFAKHIFHKKRMSASIEWFFLFFFGFYGLFAKLLGLVLIPLVLISGGYLAFLSYLGLFLFYSLFVHSLQFLIVNIKSPDKTAVLAAPFFIIYYYTVVMYAVLVAQILVFKGRLKWEKLKRYRM